MNISLSFVEYDAVNSLRDLSPAAFTLLSTATLGQSGNKRTWLVTGTPDAFAHLRGDLATAQTRFLRSSIAMAVGDVTRYIDDVPMTLPATAASAPA